MIQFNEHIFQMGWLKPPTRKMFVVDFWETFSEFDKHLLYFFNPPQQIASRPNPSGEVIPLDVGGEE